MEFSKEIQKQEKISNERCIPLITQFQQQSTYEILPHPHSLG